MNLLRLARHKKIRVPLKKILTVICCCIMTTFAWFAYTKTAQSGIDLHINSWDIEFLDANGNKITSDIQIQLDNLYPTMNTQTKKFTIKNNGEVDVNVSFNIESITMIGNRYVIVESEADATEDGFYLVKGTENTKSDDTTKDEIYYINDDSRFPFTLKLEKDKKISKNGGTGEISAIFTWSGVDETKYDLDTTWGYNMALYKELNSENTGIQFDLNIKIHQDTSE